MGFWIGTSVVGERRTWLKRCCGRLCQHVIEKCLQPIPKVLDCRAVLLQIFDPQGRQLRGGVSQLLVLADINLESGLGADRRSADVERLSAYRVMCNTS